MSNVSPIRCAVLWAVEQTACVPRSDEVTVQAETGTGAPDLE